MVANIVGAVPPGRPGETDEIGAIVAFLASDAASYINEPTSRQTAALRRFSALLRAVVRNATAGPRLPEGDGYVAATINYRFVSCRVVGIPNRNSN
jgi:hypothetical protein